MSSQTAWRQQSATVGTLRRPARRRPAPGISCLGVQPWPLALPGCGLSQTNVFDPSGMHDASSRICALAGPMPRFCLPPAALWLSRQRCSSSPWYLARLLCKAMHSLLIGCPGGTCSRGPSSVFGCALHDFQKASRRSFKAANARIAGEAESGCHSSDGATMTAVRGLSRHPALPPPSWACPPCQAACSSAEAGMQLSTGHTAAPPPPPRSYPSGAATRSGVWP